MVSQKPTISHQKANTEGVRTPKNAQIPSHCQKHRCSNHSSYDWFLPPWGFTVNLYFLKLKTWGRFLDLSFANLLLGDSGHPHPLRICLPTLAQRRDSCPRMAHPGSWCTPNSWSFWLSESRPHNIIPSSLCLTLCLWGLVGRWSKGRQDLPQLWAAFTGQLPCKGSWWGVLLVTRLPVD